MVRREAEAKSLFAPIYFVGPAPVETHYGYPSRIERVLAASQGVCIETDFATSKNLSLLLI